MSSITVEQIEAARHADLPALVSRALLLRKRGRAFWGLCPFHKEQTPSFKVEGSRYHCFGCGADGDAINWVQTTEYRTFAESVQALSSDAPNLNERGDRIQHITRNDALPRFDRVTQRCLSPQGEKLFADTRSVTPESTAGIYLIGRGCSIPPPDSDLRWHPNVYNWLHKTRWPALVGLITDTISAAPISLHITFLRRDGSGKAPIEHERLYLAGAKKNGGVVRLWPDALVTHGLAIGEGIETCLSLARGFQPVWACLDANNLGEFPLLTGIDALTIAQDEDDAGRRASHACAERWTAAGREVRILTV